MLRNKQKQKYIQYNTVPSLEDNPYKLAVQYQISPCNVNVLN